VRFSRDKRGYEYVYLVHTPTRRGKPGRSRVIYWYRTPPGVRIGRQPFDEAVQRALEQQYPGVAFDWEAIIATPMPPPDMTEFWRERRRAEKVARQERRAMEAEDAAGQEQPVEAGGSAAEEAVPQAADGPGSDAVAQGEATASTPPAVGAPTVEGQSQRKRRRRRGGRRRLLPGVDGEAAPGSAVGGEMGGAPDPELPHDGDGPSNVADPASDGE
jgi:hypothetical protein